MTEESSSKAPQGGENSEGMTPEQIYGFFKEMPEGELEKLAKDAICALDDAETRGEAEASVIKMAPFFLDCTFPRLTESMKAKMRKCLDDAEEKHGSLASVLGLDEALEGDVENGEKPASK